MKLMLTCLAGTIAGIALMASPMDDYHESERDKWGVEMGRLEVVESGEKTFKVRFSETPRPAFIGVYSSVGTIRLEVYDPNGRLVEQKNPGMSGWSATNGVVWIAPQTRGGEYTIKFSGAGTTYCFTQCHLIKTKR